MKQALLVAFVSLLVPVVIIGGLYLLERYRRRFRVLTMKATPILKEETTNWSVYFSPHGGCLDAILNWIAKAEESIYVMAYSFTSLKIADALIDASDRGVEVRVILDRSQLTAKASKLDRLTGNKVYTNVDSAHPITHSKFMVFDQKVVLTGSYNFTAEANVNVENMLVITDKDLAKKYIDDWWRHAAHSHHPIAKPIFNTDYSYVDLLYRAELGHVDDLPGRATDG